MSTVLIVDESRVGGSRLCRWLQRHNFEALPVATPATAVDAIRDQSPAVVMFRAVPRSVDLPGLCEQIRAVSNAIVIVVFGPDEHALAMAALDAGADYVVAKSIAAEELEARLRRALCRFESAQARSSPGADGFCLDRRTRSVRTMGRETRLAASEFALLEYLSQRPNRAIHREMLRKAVWGDVPHSCQSLRNVIARLRRKLEADPANPQVIVTEPWFGYRFNAGAMESARG
jgi:two-component system KDP operon response regulator KdpE